MLVECPSYMEDLCGREIYFRAKVNSNKACAINPAQNCVVKQRSFKTSTFFYVSPFIEDILDTVGCVIASFCTICPNFPKSQMNCANRINFLAHK